MEFSKEGRVSRHGRKIHITLAELVEAFETAELARKAQAVDVVVAAGTTAVGGTTGGGVAHLHIVAERNVVVRPVPFTCTPDVRVNPLPRTVSVVAPVTCKVEEAKTPPAALMKKSGLTAES